MTILQEYVAAVADRSEQYKEAEAYYSGTVPERFASAKLRHALRTTGHKGQQNYCRVVVDAVLHRLAIANIVADTQRATDFITKVWDDNELGLEAFEIHRRALEYGDCYALVWPNEEGEWEVSYASPRTTGIVYDPENPRKKLYAVKIWQQDANTVRMNVYHRDRIQKFSARGTEYTVGTQWTALEGEDNPFGEVPVFHFRTHRPFGMPEAYAAYGAQDDVNKLLATHMFTVDYQGAPQRYALAMTGDNEVVDFNDDDTERENIASLKGEPGSLWYLKGIHGVGQFQPADPKVFLEPVTALKLAIASLTDTPFHYLDRGFNVSGGEALRVAEAPLLKKVADRQVSFGATWRELFNFILKAESIKARLVVEWDTVESFDSLSEWDVMLKKINAGLSHRQALREGGYEEAEIEKIMAERALEAQEGAYYTRKPEARVSTDDNETFANRNGLTEQAKDNGGRGVAA
jgi:hypothetical protein